MKYVKSIREFLNEAEINDPEIQEKISYFYEFQDKMAKLQQELDGYAIEFKEFEQQLAPLMDAMKLTKDKLATTADYVVEITRWGGERYSASYKDAFELALTKVNAATQNILNESLEASKKLSRTKHSFKIRPSITEASLIDRVIGVVKDIVKGFLGIFKKNVDKIDDANDDLKDIAAVAKKG